MRKSSALGTLANAGWTRTAFYLAFPVLAPVACGQVSSAARFSEPAGIALAPGAGSDVLVRACTACHDLQGLEAFKGYYDRSQWHALVLTMVEHGAVLEPPEIELVTDYLVAHFGPTPTPTPTTATTTTTTTTTTREFQ
jgi:hypothetical protein